MPNADTVRQRAVDALTDNLSGWRESVSPFEALGQDSDQIRPRSFAVAVVNTRFTDPRRARADLPLRCESDLRVRLVVRLRADAARADLRSAYTGEQAALRALLQLNKADVGTYSLDRIDRRSTASSTGGGSFHVTEFSLSVRHTYDVNP